MGIVNVDTGTGVGYGNGTDTTVQDTVADDIDLKKYTPGIGWKQSRGLGYGTATFNCFCDGIVSGHITPLPLALVRIL
jgi:hypothetical protein